MYDESIGDRFNEKGVKLRSLIIDVLVNNNRMFTTWTVRPITIDYYYPNTRGTHIIDCICVFDDLNGPHDECMNAHSHTNVKSTMTLRRYRFLIRVYGTP